MKQGWLAGLAATTLFAAIPAPSPQEIVQKSVVNTEEDWHAAPQYNFTERDVVNKGSVQTKTYRVRMIDGSTYNELIAINGKPLPPAQAEQQQRKLSQVVAKRQNETAAQRSKRVGEYQRERHQDNALLKQMIEAFDFHLTGEETVGGRRCFVLEGLPKPGYQPTSRETKVLLGMRGKMWIDEQQYQWVKVEAEVFRPVAFGLFIAHVQPGTQFTLEQRPVNASLWLPSHFAMRVKANVLGIWSRNSTDDETYWDYRPATRDETAANTARR